MNVKKSKPWGGRFSQPTDRIVERFTASVAIDHRLYAEDILGSIAHARMLARIGVLNSAECDAIVAGLEGIRGEIESGQFQWSQSLEDVHMNLEAALIQRIGEAGKKLHTARSRNDQVATDLRLYLRGAIDQIRAQLADIVQVLLDRAEQEAETILPGFTHLQPAQPVSLGHHLLAWVEMLLRDMERLAQCRERVNIMPLGSAALAGSSFPVDRDFTAKELGFDRPAENSLDAVSDRDFVIEFTADASLLMMHLSRIAEELVLWSSEQFGFIDLGDAFCTGSSMMPQKRNPDVAELVRGKAGRVVGSLTALFMLMKAQPLAYNRDNQEDKQPLFDSVDTVVACLEVLLAMLPAMQFKRERMREMAAGGYTTATDLAEYLVRKGVAFRDAHEIVGKSVKYAMELGCDLSELPLDQLQQFSAAIEQDVFDVLTLEGSLRARDHLGGTAPGQVRGARDRAQKRLDTMTRGRHRS